MSPSSPSATTPVDIATSLAVWSTPPQDSAEESVMTIASVISSTAKSYDIIIFDSLNILVYIPSTFVSVLSL